MPEMRFLTVEELEGRPLDRRCITCLERAYLIWVGYKESEQVGCPFGHQRKEDCHEFAVPHAMSRADFDKLKEKGLIPCRKNSTP